MILHINTKDQKTVVVSLKRDGKILKTLSEDREYGSQVLLPLILKLLKRIGVNVFHLEGGTGRHLRIFGQLDSIEVETGPGSFTGLRVGVSVANALGYSLGIPINGKKLETDLVY